MGKITIDIEDDVLAEARERALLGGYANIEEYLVGAVLALRDEGKPLDAETEAAVLEGLNSPLEEMNDSDWQELRERAESHRKHQA